MQGYALNRDIVWPRHRLAGQLTIEARLLAYRVGLGLLAMNDHG